MRKLLNKLGLWLARRTKCYKSLEKTFQEKCNLAKGLKGRLDDSEEKLEELEMKVFAESLLKNKPIDRLYLGGLQRNFTYKLTPPELQQRARACITFKEHACESVFNELLKEYSEALFKHGENEEFRNQAHNNINVVLRVEKKIKEYAHIDKPDDDFDPNDPLYNN